MKNLKSGHGLPMTRPDSFAEEFASSPFGAGIDLFHIEYSVAQSDRRRGIPSFSRIELQRNAISYNVK
ncbi:MAG TPA: hypothetical protein V6C81_32030 [Planktothrix sp.]